MFERSKLEAIAAGKKDFPNNEEEFAQWLEAVEDDQLYTRLLVRALVVNHQKAIETLAEGGVVVTPEITREVEQIRQKRITETAERERKRIAKEQAEKKKKEQANTPKPSGSSMSNTSQWYTDVPPRRTTVDDWSAVPPLEQPARPTVGSTMDQAPPRASRVPGRIPKIQTKRKYERMIITMVAALLVVNILSFVIAWMPKKWEYRVVKVQGHATDSMQDFRSCEQNEGLLTQTLNQYRDWELVSTTTEIETVHPNYGNDKYVTGIQPNTRTCSVIFIFRK